MPRYNPNEIEQRWQRYWEDNKTFSTPEFPAAADRKAYVLDMFPYPSGDGLHVGHPEGYTATDIVSRFLRMQGTTVLHPMGFDAFGLPAEEHAIATNTPPRESTEKNIANFTRQLKMLGFSYDWDRALATTDVEYFRWTQWIFLELYDTWFDAGQQKGRPIRELPIPATVQAQGEQAVRRHQDEHRLAYQADALVNWCPALGTVLANEEVHDGKSERGGHPVQRMPLRQWMLRITAYADRLENDLEGLDWSEGIKKLQRDWIGRSTGAEVDFWIGSAEAFASWREQQAKSGFSAKPGEQVLRIYTTRPDTLFGATYMVIAPEHPFVSQLTTPQQRVAVASYCAKAAGKSDRERTEVAKSKTGVFTGSFAINPINGAATPIWIADYVLVSYGTGAIMAVPAHDARDFEFARAFDLPIIAVVDPPADAAVDRQGVLAGEACYEGEGLAINGGVYDGMTTAVMKVKIAADLAREGQGREAVNYKLRDWLFSRQRFWGEPFPILHELDEQGRPNGLMIASPTLPVDLPPLEDYKPHGRPEPPLAKAPEDWLYPVIDGQRYRRETNTMPQWAGSCWYYLRFIDPKNDKAMVDPAKERAWMPVDLYVGGAEHAVLHLLYSRFWHKVLYDRGWVSTPEPFQKLVNQGMILGDIEYTTYRAPSGRNISSVDVAKDESGQWIHKLDRQSLQAVAVGRDEVVKQGDGFALADEPAIRVDSRAHKMSKSRGNVVNPDEIVRDYGADSLRLYEMFMGPLEATKPWSMDGVNGVRGFLDRVWRLVVDERAETMQRNPAVQEIDATEEQLRALHKTIHAVTRGVQRMEFNTAIARMMEFVNASTRDSARPLSVLRAFVLLLAPFAPHLAEELWRLLGGASTLAYEPWPRFDEALARDSMIDVPVQIGGKVRARVTVPADATSEQIEQAAKDDQRVRELLQGKQVVKTVVVPGRLVNFVTR